jgi:hypothetical protein
VAPGLSSCWPKFFRKIWNENKRVSKMEFRMEKPNLMAFWFWVQFFQWFILRHEFLGNCQKSQFLRQVGFPPMGYIQRSEPY